MIAHISQGLLYGYYKGFKRCRDCNGYFHFFDTENPKLTFHLDAVDKKDAITFPIYKKNGHTFFMDERAMVDNYNYQNGLPPEKQFKRQKDIEI
jgi:hypothetical protein